MAAGKTTVARHLAARFERGVHLEGDVFRRSIVTGQAEVTPELSVEATSQLRLRYRLACTAADGYVEAGFTVVLEDVVAGHMLDEVVSMIRSRPRHVAVLLPSPDAIAARETQREQAAYGSWSVAQLYETFATGTPRIGLWLDTTSLTVEETVTAILASTES